MRDVTDEAASEALPAPPTFALDAVQLLRTTQAIQYQLSQMADQKASMLLGITFVIFTVAVGQARISATPPPLLILGGAAFVAALLTVVAVLPQTRPPPASDGMASNILFFGVFTQMTQEAFTDALLARLAEPQTLYATFAHDIYQNGKVLAGKKYRLLGYAYRVLLIGLVASLVAFVAPYGLRLVGR